MINRYLFAFTAGSAICASFPAAAGPHTDAPAPAPTAQIEFIRGVQSTLFVPAMQGYAIFDERCGEPIRKSDTTGFGGGPKSYDIPAGAPLTIRAAAVFTWGTMPPGATDRSVCANWASFTAEPGHSYVVVQHAAHGACDLSFTEKDGGVPASLVQGPNACSANAPKRWRTPDTK